MIPGGTIRAIGNFFNSAILKISFKLKTELLFQYICFIF